MSYPSLENKEEFLGDLLSRKEFYSLKSDIKDDFRNKSDISLGPLADRYLKLHSHQLFVRNFLSPNTPYKRLHLLHGTGCHAAGTKVLLSSGRSIEVEKVKIGDKLAGDRGQRTVLGLLRGYDVLYKINLIDSNESFVCNYEHVLTLKFGETIIDMPIYDYLLLPAYVKTYARMYREIINIPYKLVSGVDPFKCGQNADTTLPIDENIKYNSLSVQLCYLNGLLKREGKISRISGSYIFLKDLQFICRCIGISAIFTNNNSYNELIISEKPIMERFTIEKLPIDDSIGKYYGFTLDGNGRYLLDNFIVTHNSGKTLAAVSIANEFIKIYKRMYSSAQLRIGVGRRYQVELDRATPSVFVLGFSGAKGAFIRELIDFPEFGFITITEHDELLRLRTAAMSGLPDDVQILKEFTGRIRRRIQNKSKEGFYKFFGYDEFINRLFLTDKLSLVDIEYDVNNRIKQGEEITLEDAVKKHIRSGEIQINTDLVAMFENSLMICDEIHNTYNSGMKNNRGIAIQYILDTVPTVRFLSMSATPINNSPTEIVELINYLNVEKIQKSDLFVNNRTLKQDALEKIGSLTFGKVSFLQKVDLKYFPKRVFKGEYLSIPSGSDIKTNFGSQIPYIKFIDCAMSDFHQKTFDAYAVSQGENPEKYYTVPTEGYSIYDIAFPNPENANIGLFKSSETKSKINSASGAWKDQNKIFVKKFSSTNTIITGAFLHESTIGKYSTKLLKTLQLVKDIISKSNNNPDKVEKIMIYHNRVKMSGVLLIQELLRENGFIDTMSEPVDGTICCVCGKQKIDHKETVAAGESTDITRDLITNSNAILGAACQNFIPSRFVMIHSSIDKNTIEQSITNFNAPDNLHGKKIHILVGSKIMKESYNIKDTQNLLLLSLPTDIPTFIQVIGRCVRTNSHIRLPLNQRKVDIYVLVSTTPGRVSPELYRYIDKLDIYRIIQSIEREINRNSVDADVHRGITMNKELLDEYFPDGSSAPTDILGNLYFDPKYKMKELSYNELNLSTFTSYKYYLEEIKNIIYIIKRMFMMSSVYTYDALWAAIRNPPISIETNPKLFSEGNFVIALNHMITPSTNIISMEKVSMSESYFIERLFDQNEKYIYIDKKKHTIVHISKYYILFPMSDIPDMPINNTIGVNDIITGKKISTDRPSIDVETYLRAAAPKSGIRISISNYIKHSKTDINFNITRLQFIEKYSSADECAMFNMLTEYSADFQKLLIEEIIKAKMLGETTPNEGLYQKIITLFNKFKVFIYLTDIIKYKDVVKHYKTPIDESSYGKLIPIGYISAKSVRLYDVTDSKWFEVSKLSLNRHITYKENDIIIGYFEDAPDHMKFKIRKSVQFIREDIRKDIIAKQTKTETEYMTSYRSRNRAITGDTRLVERGIVCSTKGKYELLKILANLGVSISKLDRGQIRIKKLCWLIRMRLIENEIKERQKDTKYKWLYSWFDQQPALT